MRCVRATGCADHRGSFSSVPCAVHAESGQYTACAPAVSVTENMNALAGPVGCLVDSYERVASVTSPFCTGNPGHRSAGFHLGTTSRQIGGDDDMRLRALLDTDALGLRLLGGAEELDRTVRGVMTTDLRDPSRYMSGGELVLTGLAWRREPDDSERFVRVLAAAGVAGLAAGEAELGPVPED